MNRKTRSHRKKTSKSLNVSVQTDYRRVVAIAGLIGVLLLVLLFLGKRLGARFLETDRTPTPTPYFTGNVSPDLTAQPSAPTATPTPAPPTATPTPSISISDYTIQILNGNGIAGSASEAQNLVEEKGFNVSSVTNASRWDYGPTEIRGSDEVPIEVLNTLNQVLEAIYVTEIKTSSVNTNGYDILVVLGRNQN